MWHLAVTGAVVCRLHGGSAPQVKQKAAERIAEDQARRELEQLDALLGPADPINNPLTELQQLGGEAKRWKELLALGSRNSRHCAMKARPVSSFVPRLPCSSGRWTGSRTFLRRSPGCGSMNAWRRSTKGKRIRSCKLSMPFLTGSVWSVSIGCRLWGSLPVVFVLRIRVSARRSCRRNRISTVIALSTCQQRCDPANSKLRSHTRCGQMPLKRPRNRRTMVARMMILPRP